MGLALHSGFKPNINFDHKEPFVFGVRCSTKGNSTFPIQEGVRLTIFGSLQRKKPLCLCGCANEVQLFVVYRWIRTPVSQIKTDWLSSSISSTANSGQS